MLPECVKIKGPLSDEVRGRAIKKVGTMRDMLDDDIAGHNNCA